MILEYQARYHEFTVNMENFKKQSKIAMNGNGFNGIGKRNNMSA